MTSGTFKTYIAMGVEIWETALEKCINLVSLRVSPVSEQLLGIKPHNTILSAEAITGLNYSLLMTNK